jgi:PAS domain S-box-containing protein
MPHVVQGKNIEPASILVVEDEQIVAADILRRLERMGYRVPAIASTGEEAIVKVEEIHPDLLLMDIVLQGPPDGIQAVQEIQSRNNLPIVYLTAYSDQETVRRAKQTQPFGFLMKPFDERELHFTIEMALFKHQAERELRRTEEIFREISDTSDEVHWLMDAGLSATLYVNPAFERIWGVQRPEPSAGLGPWVSSIHPEDRSRVETMYLKARRGEFEDTGMEYRIVRPDGLTRWIWTRAFPVRDRSNKIYRIAGICQDITRQKWAWETLRESEERYRLLAENARDMISRHNPDGVFLYASPASRALLGYKPEDLLGRSLVEFIHPEDLHQLLSRHTSLAEAFAAEAVGYRARKADGTYAWIETSVRQVRSLGSDTVNELAAVTRDITERKEREETLRRFEFIANTSHELMALINRDYIHEAANDAYCHVLGKSRSEVVGHSLASVWLPDTFAAAIKAPLEQCFAGKEGQYEVWCSVPEGGRRCFDIRHYPYVNYRGDVTHVVVIALDTTSRKMVEEQTQGMLKEKEVLLKEIHHRVKNNLQIISSLLNLQLNVITNAETRELIRESQNRVRSMALIHEKLYQSDNLGQISLEEYLRSLTRDLFRSYGIGGVNLKLEIDDIRLDVDTAVPCGLIVNELVSNALKYAFPAGREGQIHLRCGLVSKNQVALSVADNGVGLPDDMNLRTSSTLGFQLVHMLVKQLRGTLDIVKNGGTTFMITFPLKGIA